MQAQIDVAAARTTTSDAASSVVVGFAVFGRALWLGRWMWAAPATFLEARRTRAVFSRSLAERANASTPVNVTVVRAMGVFVLAATSEHVSAQAARGSASRPRRGPSPPPPIAATSVIAMAAILA